MSTKKAFCFPWPAGFINLYGIRTCCMFGLCQISERASTKKALVTLTRFEKLFFISVLAH